jgi:futalosine hydrolase
MRVLIVAATAMEIAPLVASLHFEASRGQRLNGYTHAGHNVDVLVTGVGMVATAAWTSRVLTESRYDLGLNLGVCGSFDPAFPPGSVVHVASDRIAELGAESDDGFVSIDDLGLPAEYTFVNAAVPENAALSGLPIASGITVNTVHGSEESIATVVRRFNPDVESMEGAGFMHACQIHGIAFAQVRAVSNIVEKRNREAWTLDEAIAALARAALDILDNA